jgi:hypothetical protein
MDEGLKKQALEWFERGNHNIATAKMPSSFSPMPDKRQAQIKLVSIQLFGNIETSIAEETVERKADLAMEMMGIRRDKGKLRQPLL